MNRVTKSLKSILVLTILLSFLSTLFFGIFHINMDMSSEGQISQKCFMPGMSTMCQMSPIEHISAWQNMFTAIPGGINYLVVFLILFTLIISRLALLGRIRQLIVSLPSLPLLILYRKRYFPIPSYIQEAFSSGILHPKLY